MMQKLISAIGFAFCSLLAAQTAILPIPTYAPVPATGIGPKVPTDVGFRVEAFGNGAYMITDGAYQALFLVANESVVVVDAPPTIGHKILIGIQTITDLPISHLVYSHAHADHIGAAYLVTNQNTTIIAQEETAKQLTPSLNMARPLPNVTFADDYELTVGNQTLQLSYKGPNHEVGNIFIYAPAHKVLMIVDVIYPGWVPFANLAESQYIPEWIDAHDQILEYDFTYIVNGHLNRVGKREDVLIQKEYVSDLYDNCFQATILSGEPANDTNPLSFSTALAGVTAANPNNSWAIFRYGSDLLGEWCVNKTNEKWLGRLAGADVYGPSNAAVMLESLKLDFGILGAAGVQGQ